MKSMSFRGAALCGLSLLALTPIASAAEAALQPWTVAAADSPAQPVVVTATRIAQPVSQALADVRVIGAEQLSNAGAMSVLEVLQLYGGAEIASNGGPGQLSSVFLRGTESKHVVVLVDGVRVNSATDGGNAFETLPLNQIERIEVLRGPASSLYGADAIGGVIQIFTRQGEHTQARVGAGTWSTYEASASMGRRFGDTSVSLRGGYTRTDGINATSPASGFYFNPDRDGYRSRNLGATLSQDWSRGHTVTARAWGSEGDVHFDSGLGSDDRSHRRLSGLSAESRDQITDTWHSLLRLARGTDDYRTEGSFPSSYRTDQDQFTWQNDFTLPAGSLAAGLEWRREQVDSTTQYTRIQRIVRSAFASYAVSLDAHRVEASLRKDDDSQFGGHTTGRLGYGYQLTPAWRLSAAGGTAFKAPSFNQLYWPLSFGFQGNPDLRPERARNVEAALRYGEGPLRGGLTVFRNRVRDLITSSPDFSTVVNLNRARIQGATLDAAYVTALWSARAEWTQQSPENADNGLRLNRRARHFGSAGLDWTPGPWRAGVEVVGSGRRFDDAGNITPIGGYVLLNLRAAYAITPALSVSARLNNVADKSYELAHGYNTPGRNLFVALEYAPK